MSGSMNIIRLFYCNFKLLFLFKICLAFFLVKFQYGRQVKYTCQE